MDFFYIFAKIYHMKILLLETLLVEINLKKRFLNGSYNPNKCQITHHLIFINPPLDKYSNEYENFF